MGAPEPAELLFPDDLALMQRVAAGERDAQEELVARLLRRFEHIVQSLVRSSDQREDLTQGALLEILLAARTYEGRAPLANWADRIAVRHTLRTLKRVRQRAFELDETLDETPSAQIEDEPMAEDLPRSAAAYLGQLAEGARAILVMRHVVGASLKEIALEMELSVPQVKKQLYHAKQRMRRLIRRDRVVGIALRKPQ